MKRSTAILSIMVTLSLAFSIAAFALVAQNSGLFAPNTPSSTQTSHPTIYATTPPATNYPTLQPTQNPTPITKPSPTTNITLNYQENSHQDLHNDKTRVIYTVTATYHSGQEITINYSDFKLKTYAPRDSFTFFGTGEAYPQNSGSFILSPSNPTETVQLTFEIPTLSFNGMDLVKTAYDFTYIGAAALSSS